MIKLKRLNFTNQKLTTLVLTIMLWLNLFIALFPANNGSPLWRIISGENAYTGVLFRILTFVNFCGSILILLLNRKITSSIILMMLFIMSISFFFSKTINLYPGDSVGLIVIPLEYLVFYIILKQYSLQKQLKLILPFLALWIAVPLVIFLFGPIGMKLKYISIDPMGRIGTYGGFALHRNYLGYYVGLITILILYSNWKKTLKVIALLIGLTAIFVSTSRSAIVCLLVALVIYSWNSLKKWRIPFIIIITITGGLYYYLSTQIQFRQTDITNTSARENLIAEFKDSIAENPLLGKGRDTILYNATYPNGAQAHNFIAQIWSDYGIFTLIFFIGYWGALFILGNNIVKTFTSYIIMIGLFQPYFTLCIPPPFVWLDILLIACVGGFPRLNDKYLVYDKNIKE